MSNTYRYRYRYNVTDLDGDTILRNATIEQVVEKLRCLSAASIRQYSLIPKAEQLKRPNSTRTIITRVDLAETKGYIYELEKMLQEISSDKLDAETIIAFAENGMNKSKAARTVFCDYETVVYRFKRIIKKTGKNPQNFYDLVELMDWAKETLKEVKRLESEYQAAIERYQGR